ncbi:MAG: sugar transferase [Candidatus Zixiibacteriota bacterium]
MAIDINLKSKDSVKSRFNVYQESTGELKQESTILPKSGKHHYWLENAVYFILKIGTMALLFSVLNLGHELIGTGLSIFIFSILAGLQVLSYLRKPNNNIYPIRKARANVQRFIKSEVKFLFLLCTFLYIVAIQIQPPELAVFVLLNLTAQSTLFYLWKRYNTNRLLNRINIGADIRAEKNIIIIGASERGKKAADIFLQYSDLNANIIGFVDFYIRDLWRYRDIPLLGHADSLSEIIATRQVDYIVMATEPDDYLYSREIFAKIEKMGIDICVLPDIYDYDRAKVRNTFIDDNPVLMYCSTKNCHYYNIGKTFMDKVGAILGLLISSPILLTAAIAIKLDSPGPVLFKQKRSGKNGKIFNMLKLRTMTNGADHEKEKLMHLNEMSGPVFKIKNDPRITRVGKLLRKYSIDEFPQFFNILKGDMSLVGPRPPLPNEVTQYQDWQRRRLAVKPGATCLWQINGRNHVDFDKWIKLDLKYIDNWSLKEDVRIILKTFPAVLRGNGAS